MTTRTDRHGLEVLSYADCMQLLTTTPVGRVAFVANAHVVILPVNHVVLGNRIAFLTAPGSKLDAATAAGQVAFEVDGFDVETRTGWSVLVSGRAFLLDQHVDRAHIDDQRLEPWADRVVRSHWVAIDPARITGRRIHRGAAD